MRVEVMKVAQQPAMAYDKVPLTTGVISWESGLILNSPYVGSPRLSRLDTRAFFRRRANGDLAGASMRRLMCAGECPS